MVISYCPNQKAHQKVRAARVTDKLVKIVSIDVRLEMADDYLCCADSYEAAKFSILMIWVGPTT